MTMAGLPPAALPLKGRRRGTKDLSLPEQSTTERAFVVHSTSIMRLPPGYSGRLNTVAYGAVVKCLD